MEQILPQQPSGVTNPADALILEFKHLELRGINFLLFKTPSYYYFVKAALKNKIQSVTAFDQSVVYL